MKKEKKIDVLKDAEALIQMYQAGFLDGFNCNAYHNKKFKDVLGKCKRAFEFRFANKLQGKIKLKNEKKTKMQIL